MIMGDTIVTEIEGTQTRLMALRNGGKENTVVCSDMNSDNLVLIEGTLEKGANTDNIASEIIRKIDDSLNSGFIFDDEDIEMMTNTIADILDNFHLGGKLDE